MKLVRIKELPDLAVSHNPLIRKRVMVERGTLPGMTQYSRAVFPPGEKAGEHLHNDLAEVFTCESGRGEIRVNDVGYVFEPGVTVVVEPGETHELINSGDVDLVVTYFGLEVTPP